MPPLGTLVVGSQLLIAVAGGVPTIDLKNTCGHAAGLQTTTTQNDIDICLKDEQEARAAIIKEWAKFSAADKSYCLQMATTGYLPSYVELITCLEMSTFAKTVPAQTPSRTKRQQR